MFGLQCSNKLSAFNNFTGNTGEFQKSRNILKNATF